MQRTIIGLLVLVMTAPLFAQSNWARRVGAWSNDAFNDMVVDGVGNNYVTGEFGGLFTYEGTVLSSQGSLDIMVAKFDPNGQLLWIKGFGGTGFDRGIALALGPNNELAVTGQFMGSMTLGTQTLVSAGGTQDMFVMRIDPSDGSVIWAAQGGGPDGVDQPNGISIGPGGDVAVTGEFRGNAIFGSTTLTSIDDPDTGLPSVDVFVVSYSVSGVQSWLKQGASERADRGIDVVHDLLGNVYVTGQFSDTITFDVTHNNGLFSAVFIIKFDQAGNEQWFRIMGGGIYQQVFDMDLIAGTSLMLTGDVQGTVIFQDTSPDLFTAVEARSSFLVEVDLNGEFIRQTTWGSDNVVNTRSMAVIGTEVMVLGRFQCQFTGFSALYDTGTWLATGQHDLYIASFDLDSLYLKGAQQFGGQKNKVPGAIASSVDGEPVFCGSFDRVLIFPKDNAAWSTTPTVSLLYSPSVPSTYCADPDYGRYLGLRGGGLLDGFIARGYVASREPYDYFTRTGSNCVRPQLDVAVILGGTGITGLDTLFACGSAALSVMTNTAYSPDTSIYHTAPDLEFLWNNGVDSTQIHVYQSGWVGVTITSKAGCWQRMDSAYIVVDPIPARPLAIV